MENKFKKSYSRYKDFFLNIWRIYNTKPTLKMYLELMLSLATVGIFAIFAIKPTILTIIELNKEIKGKEVTISKLKQKIKNLQTASFILTNESESLSLIEDAVPSESFSQILVKQIETVATLNSVQINSLSINDVLLSGNKLTNTKTTELPPLEGGAEELPMSISVKGDYLNLMNFLSNLETLRRPIKIDSFLFSSSVTEEGNILTLTIAGRFPFLYDGGQQK